jgi:hypothetical protein
VRHRRDRSAVIDRWAASERLGTCTRPAVPRLTLLRAPTRGFLWEFSLGTKERGSEVRADPPCSLVPLAVQRWEGSSVLAGAGSWADSLPALLHLRHPRQPSGGLEDDLVQAEPNQRAPENALDPDCGSVVCPREDRGCAQGTFVPLGTVSRNGRTSPTGQLQPGGQQPEAMDDERKLARPRPSPTPAESPLGERQPKRAQRALYPLGPTHPPPSPPPSPPQSPGRGDSARAGADSTHARRLLLQVRSHRAKVPKANR